MLCSEIVFSASLVRLIVVTRGRDSFSFCKSTISCGTMLRNVPWIITLDAADISRVFVMTMLSPTRFHEKLWESSGSSGIPKVSVPVSFPLLSTQIYAGRTSSTEPAARLPSPDTAKLIWNCWFGSVSVVGVNASVPFPAFPVSHLMPMLSIVSPSTDTGPDVGMLGSSPLVSPSFTSCRVTTDRASIASSGSFMFSGRSIMICSSSTTANMPLSDASKLTRFSSSCSGSVTDTSAPALSILTRRGSCMARIVSESSVTETLFFGWIFEPKTS